jgi:secreted trypsin-like serine protease
MKARRHFDGRQLAVAFACAILATFLLLPAGASARGGAEASIIGGRGASVAELPSLAYIEASVGRGGFACTGTVVAPRVVLTAAHCIERQESGTITPAGDYAVATGTTTPRRALPENVFRVVEAHVFPGFDPGNLRGDAGILVLDRPTAAAPLPLAGAADAALYAGGAPIELAGWGLTRANAGNGPASLRSTSMTVQAPSRCKQRTQDYYRPYSAAVQLCVLATPAKKSGGCFGDSGGPGIGQRADGTPVHLGIVSSSGPFCSTKVPNVLTRTDLVSSWVAEWAAAVEAGGPRPVVDPDSPFPMMTRPAAETFTVFTLQGLFGGSFDRARDLRGACRRASRTRFRCSVTWFAGRNIYAGTVSPFYLRRQGAVTWDSRFRIEWAALRCLRSNAPRCPIHTRRG